MTSKTNLPNHQKVTYLLFATVNTTNGIKVTDRFEDTFRKGIGFLQSNLPLRNFTLCK
ncbi:MAG: hypothetical protein ACK5ML_03140 [Lachnospiraceae bacterium]